MTAPRTADDKAQSLAVLDWMIEHTATIEYRDIARDLTAAGFVQRHVLRLDVRRRAHRRQADRDLRVSS